MFNEFDEVDDALRRWWTCWCMMIDHESHSIRWCTINAYVWWTWWCTMMYDEIDDEIDHTRWCMINVMMYEDVWWCMMMYDDVWWCMLMYDDVWWCMMMYDDVWWCMMMYDDVWWCTMMYDDVWWCMMMYDGIDHDVGLCMLKFMMYGYVQRSWWNWWYIVAFYEIDVWWCIMKLMTYIIKPRKSLYIVVRHQLQHTSSNSSI